MDSVRRLVPAILPPMVLDLLMIAGGGVLLYLGAEWLVHGAAGLARTLGVPPLVIGLTVVAYGTSAPEAVVSGVAAIGGSSAIAIGNVVGSNIANLALILGITALISPPLVEGTLIRREVPVLVLSAFAVLLVVWNDQVTRFEAGVLFAGAVAFTAWQVWLSKRAAPGEALEAAAELPATPPRGGAARLIVTAIVGLVGLVAGGKFFVDGSVGIALALGISERVVGLTIVAVGTSLPELAASVVAALRGHSAIAVGNVIGSNIFNVLLIIGFAGLIRPIDLPLVTMQTDILFMIGVTILAAAMMRGERYIHRVDGTILVGMYVAFLLSVALV